MPKVVIGVIGPGAAATASDLQFAYDLGQKIAAAGWVLLTGGRNVGVMDAASQGAKQSGGLTIGILPTEQLTDVSAAIDIPILTAMGSARNNINVLSSQVVIACGMGLGTASEIALALKANKPVILLNTSAEAQAFFQALAPKQIQIADHPEAAVELVRVIVSDLDNK
jgi:uncharacterized protein (TIGR00725 family)